MNSFPFKMNFIYYKTAPNIQLQKNISSKASCLLIFCPQSQVPNQQFKIITSIFDLYFKKQTHMNPGHQPQRFEVFNYLPDQRSFTIKDTNYIFHLDKFGGWFDQYGNYYNQDAQPDEPPSSSQEQQLDQERSILSSDDSDEFEKQFGRPRDVSDDEAEEQNDVAAIADNLTCLETYPKDTMVRVYFGNLGYNTTKADLATAYGQRVKGLLNIIIDQRGGKNVGTGYFIMQDSFTATALINLQGNKIVGIPLFFEVEKYENNIMEPITEEELNRKQKPRFVLKRKQEEIKVDIPWRWYKFERVYFPKKSAFKQWMQEKGLIFEQDFKQIEKIDNDPEKKYAKIEMRVSTFNSINGLQCDGKKVEFIPMEQ